MRLLSVLLQTQGRTLPREIIYLKSASFATGADVSWSREVVRDASISCVSDGECVEGLAWRDILPCGRRLVCAFSPSRLFALCPSQIPLNVWAIFYPSRCSDEVEELISTFKKVAGPIGVPMQRPLRVELRDDRTETYVKNIQSLLASQV